MKVDGNTAQNIIRMPEEKFIVAGARMFARKIHRIFSDDGHLRNTKTIMNTLRFFSDSCPTSEMELFIYDLDNTVRMEKCGKSKTEFSPIKVLPHPSGRTINPYEFISEDEQKYRELCRILLDMLKNTACVIAAMSGREEREVLNQLVDGANLKARNDGWKVEVVKDKNETD